MSPIHSISFIVLILIIVGVIVGVHTALEKDTLENETATYKKQIYLVAGIFCFLLVIGFLVFVSKSK